MMAGIRGKDTQPELRVRRLLHHAGLRYRLHVRELPGRPDLVFPGRRAVIFVHGCFWHRHGCHLTKEPSTRSEFWSAKLKANVQRDQVAVKELRDQGWRVATIWECALKGRSALTDARIRDWVLAWLRNDSSCHAELPESPQ